MKQLQKLLWLTQLGVSLVTPPLLCLLLGHLAQSKWGWGTWVMVAAILIGLAASACSAASFLRDCKRNSEREGKGDKPIAFNNHE